MGRACRRRRSAAAHAGALISGDLGALDPERVVGAHVNTDPTGLALLDFLPAELDGLSEAEAASHQRLREYGAEGKGYLQIQGTRPRTLSYALTDSPAGQLAWIVEKLHPLSNPGYGTPGARGDRHPVWPPNIAAAARVTSSNGTSRRC